LVQDIKMESDTKEEAEGPDPVSVAAVAKTNGAGSGNKL
jgi:hypothetical protein